MKAQPAVLVVVTLTVAASAAANSRKPIEVAQHGSRAMTHPLEGVEVNSEDLRFTCEADVCRVTATYELTAKQTARGTMRFVLPTQQEVVARVNGEIAKIAVEELTPEVPRSRWGDDTPQPLWQAAFTASIRAGENTMQVRYKQPLGLIETRQSHLGSSDFAFTLSYELWPLKEWSLAATFNLDVGFDIARDKGFWDWLKAPDPVLDCEGMPKTARKVVEVSMKRKLSDTVDTYSHRFSAQFPDVLSCQLSGDQPTTTGHRKFPFTD